MGLPRLLLEAGFENERLKILRADKQRILETVMETETFNKAQQILRRFDPLMLAKLTVMDHEVRTPVKSTNTSDEVSSLLRHRRIKGPDGDASSASQTPLQKFASKGEDFLSNIVQLHQQYVAFRSFGCKWDSLSLLMFTPTLFSFD
ncbi:unnamed protein product [Dicrocoelium dendriticum]|nr:unnamed protein product [Dicrocoelium dendriticum]